EVGAKSRFAIAPGFGPSLESRRCGCTGVARYRVRRDRAGDPDPGLDRLVDSLELARALAGIDQEGDQEDRDHAQQEDLGDIHGPDARPDPPPGNRLGSRFPTLEAIPRHILEPGGSGLGASEELVEVTTPAGDGREPGRRGAGQD